MTGRLPDQFDDEIHAWVYECPDCTGLEGPYRWFVSEPKGGQSSRRHSGIMADLGMYDAVIEAVARIPDRWLEFGVVEALFAEVAPDAFEELVRIYGHVAIRQDTNTATWMIGRAVWAVTREGALTVKPAKPTGRWDYLSGIDAWSLPGKPTSPEPLTWTDFATQRGEDPMKCYYVDRLRTGG